MKIIQGSAIVITCLVLAALLCMPITSKKVSTSSRVPSVVQELGAEKSLAMFWSNGLCRG